MEKKVFLMNTDQSKPRLKTVYDVFWGWGSRNSLEQELRKERGRRGSQHSDTLLGKTPPNRDMRQQVEDIRKVTLHLKMRNELPFSNCRIISVLMNCFFIYLIYLFRSWKRSKKRTAHFEMC